MVTKVYIGCYGNSICLWTHVTDVSLNSRGIQINVFEQESN